MGVPGCSVPTPYLALHQAFSSFDVWRRNGISCSACFLPARSSVCGHCGHSSFATILCRSLEPCSDQEGRRRDNVERRSFKKGPVCRWHKGGQLTKPSPRWLCTDWPSGWRVLAWEAIPPVEGTRRRYLPGLPYTLGDLILVEKWPDRSVPFCMIFTAHRMRELKITYSNAPVRGTSLLVNSLRIFFFFFFFMEHVTSVILSILIAFDPILFGRFVHSSPFLFVHPSLYSEAIH